MMRVAWKWLLVGTLVMVGALWFAARGAMALELEVDSFMVITAAFAIGALVGGATIARHATVRPWVEPMIAAGLASGIFALVGHYGDGMDSVSGPMSGTTAIENVVAIAAVLAATLAGASLAHRFSAREPTTPSLLILGGLVTIGAVMFIVGVLAQRGGGDVTAVDMAIILGVPAIGGFITQAMVAVRRPWACGGGAMLLFLLFVQEDGSRHLGSTFVGLGVVTLIDVAGAAIAARVFRARWAARVAVPEAQAR